MSVTVVGRWHVPVDDADQAIASARQELVARTGFPRARRNAQVFQANDDAGMLLYVGEWSDRAAFEQYRAEAATGTVEAAIRDAGEYLICERMLFFGNYAYRAVITGCGIIEAPPEAGDAIRELLVPNGRWAMHGSPGLVHYAVYREVTHSHRYVIVHGWQSEAALLTLREGREQLQAALDTFGGTVVQFSGYERASTDIL
jgi:quinol monooxygenase YgiN